MLCVAFISSRSLVAVHDEIATAARWFGQAIGYRSNFMPFVRSRDAFATKRRRARPSRAILSSREALSIRVRRSALTAAEVDMRSFGRCEIRDIVGIVGRRRPFRCLTSFAVLALSGLGCYAAAAQQADSVNVAYSITADWITGFSAELTLRNEASWSITDWRLSFDFAPEIGSIWNARVLSRRGTEYVVGPTEAAWDDGELAPGETVVIGFVATGSPRIRPANGYLNGAPVSLAGASPAPGSTLQVVPPPQWPARVFAPYVDATAWPGVDLAAAAGELGVQRFRLGFVVAQSASQAVPTWGGVQSASASFRLREINALRAQGGDVAIAFGGAAGTELAVAARSAAETAAAYKSVIDAYDARVVDFDLEGAALADAPSIRRRAEALSALEQWTEAEGRPLEIWLTLPISPSGLTAAGVEVVRSALEHGIALRGVNAMTMDFGAAAAPNPDGRMGGYSIEAARNLHAQLQSLYARNGTPHDAAALWRMIGITPMIGVNDVPAEVFRDSDARQMLEFAIEAQVGLLSFWSLNRDRPCAAPQTGVSPSCSGVSQGTYEFARIFRPFTEDRLR
jgi:Cellulose binding domain